MKSLLAGTLAVAAGTVLAVLLHMRMAEMSKVASTPLTGLLYGLLFVAGILFIFVMLSYAWEKVKESPF